MMGVACQYLTISELGEYLMKNYGDRGGCYCLDG